MKLLELSEVRVRDGVTRWKSGNEPEEEGEKMITWEGLSRCRLILTAFPLYS